MTGFLDEFRKNVVASVWKDGADEKSIRQIDDKIALGVLLWVVAEADNKFLPEEHEKINQTLISYGKVPEEDIATISASIEEAARERIDLYRFTHEVSQKLPYNVKVSIIEKLFRVACVDKDLDDAELEAIRKISGLFQVSHKDFIDTKINVKKEFGLDTAGL